MKTTVPTMHWLPGDYTVIRMPGDAAPGLPEGTGFRALLKDGHETTIVAGIGDVTGLRTEGRSEPWRAIHPRGPLPHDAVGILAGLATVLANRGVPIFALSTFGTDYVLVPSDRAPEAHRALLDAGYTIHNAP